MFAYYEVGVTTLEAFFQMMGRVRILNTNAYHLVIGGNAQRCAVDLGEIHKEFIEKILTACSDGPASKLHFDY